MTRAAAGLIAGTAVATALLPAAIAPARPKRPPRPPRAHAAGITLGVSSLPVDAITATSAVLRTTATVSLLGADVAFQYGPTTSYGSSSKSKRTSLVGLAETITIPITALTPSTTYHFRPVIWSGSKAVYGRDQWFTTTAQGAAPGTTDQGQDTSQPDTATTGDDGSGDHGDSGSGSGSSDDSGSTGGAGAGDGGADSGTTKDPGSSTDDAIKDKSSSPSGDTSTKSGDSNAT